MSVDAQQPGSGQHTPATLRKVWTAEGCKAHADAWEKQLAARETGVLWNTVQEMAEANATLRKRLEALEKDRNWLLAFAQKQDLWDDEDDLIEFNRIAALAGEEKNNG